jgi:hypothetical protein
MNLQNYTNINIFKQAFEQTQVSTSNDMIAHSHNHTQAKPNAQHQFNPY